MYRFKIIFIINLLSLYSVQAQKVTNVSNRQEQSTIIVSYDLETKKPCKIALYVSTNGGTTWQGPLKKVTGDVGVNIISGSKTITWNVLEEFDELKGTNIMFQIRAVDTSFETIKIDNQVWMKKNLDVSTYRNGDIIPEVKDPFEWSKLTTGAWCYYNNDPENGKIYGKLYNWYAVHDPRGLAIKGFHIPTQKEFSMIKSYNELNESNKLLGGFRNGEGTFGRFGSMGCWTSSENSKDYAWYLIQIDNNEKTYENYTSKQNGFSVRCIKDSK